MRCGIAAVIASLLLSFSSATLPAAGSDVFRGFRISAFVRPNPVDETTDPRITVTIENNSRSSASIVTTHYAVLEIGLAIVDRDGHGVRASLHYPSEMSRRSRLLEPGESYTTSGLLSDWGYRLEPGTYRVYIQRASLKNGSADLKTSTTLTVR